MNDTVEQRIVIKDKTFNDIAVNELGKQRARCICCIQFGRCKQSHCKTCKYERQYNELVSAMSVYDKQRLSSYISSWYNKYSAQPGAFMTNKGFKRYTLGNLLLVLLFLVLLIGTISLSEVLPGDRPPVTSYYEIPADLDERISNMRSYVAVNVYDHNRDGTINCIDYATCFYEYWALYNSEECEIVRNYGSGNMNHLFVIIYTDELMIEIEPWYNLAEVNTYMHSTPVYLMSDIWGSLYDRRYNIYGETVKWVMQR